MENISIFNKFNAYPENLKEEVINFIDFLVEKKQKNKEVKTPKFCSCKAMFEMVPDFDVKPLDDFKDYMY